MDEPLTQAPIITDPELQTLIDQAESTYKEHFNGDVWLGRCIFLSFYCSVNTCDFCFRSVSHKSKHDPEKAMRSLGSILSEALLIKAFDWRIEFLTGGYGIADFTQVQRYVKLVKAILDEPIWLNLGVLPGGQLKELCGDVGGIVASLETLEPSLHKKTCPDKPIEPYVRMLNYAKEYGMKRSITLVIGLGETRDDWTYVEEFMTEHSLERITIYALRPVQGTPYEHGPTSQEVAWWIAKVRTTFPTVEIIAGTAEYRIPEVPLFLKAGANAITKLPVTKMFNKQAARELEDAIAGTGRTWVSKISHEDPELAIDFDKIIASLDLSDDEREELKTVLERYLKKMTLARSKI